MSIAERIKARTSARQSTNVPEWGEDGGDFLVYYGPLLAGEVSRIQKKHGDLASLEAQVDLIISKSEDADGSKLFKLDDKPILMREDFRVIARLAGDIASGQSSVEDHEKN